MERAAALAAAYGADFAPESQGALALLLPDSCREIAVAPEAQRQGIGSALVRASIEHARHAGCTALVLSSAAWMHAGHRLYERLGFHHTPERDWQPRADVHLTTYRLDLAP